MDYKLRKYGRVDLPIGTQHKYECANCGGSVTQVVTVEKCYGDMWVNKWGEPLHEHGDCAMYKIACLESRVLALEVERLR